MNWERLGLHRRPFRAAPALELYVPLPSHERTLRLLRTAFESGDGIALLDGLPGTGKTLIALRFLESLGSEVVPIFIPSAQFATAVELHQAILFDLGIPFHDGSPAEIRRTVADILLKSVEQSRRFVLVLDEAQLLADAVLEEIRQIDNWGARGIKAAFTLLVAQQDLHVRLRSPNHERLAGRIHPRLHLDPLPIEESELLLSGQMEMCSRTPDESLNREALKYLAAAGRGNPRRLNRLAGTSLALALEAELSGVDIEVAEEAWNRFELESGTAGEPVQPVNPAGPSRSGAQESGEAGEGRESGAARPPKQKARTRRVA